MKKLTTLLLCAVLVLATAACAAPEQPSETNLPQQTETNQPTTQPPVTEPAVTEPPVTNPPAHEKFDLVACMPLRGSWSATIKLNADLLNLERFTEETSFQLNYSFDKHGQYSVSVDMKEFTAAIETYEKLVVDHMVQMQYSQYKITMGWKGHSAAKIDEMWKDGPEADARTACAETVDTMNLYHRFMKLTRQGQYYVEDGALFLQNGETGFESCDYLVNNGELTLENTNNPGLYRSLNIQFPFVLTQSE